MVGTKSGDYSNTGQLSECGYSGLFFSTHPSPNYNKTFALLSHVPYIFPVNRLGTTQYFDYMRSD